MENIDNRVLHHVCEEDLFMSQVICGDAELLYLDAFLHSIFNSEA